MMDARQSDGEIGLESLVALLLSLEARLFVFSIGSNWGRLINELRKTRLENQCRPGGNLQSCESTLKWTSQPRSTGAEDRGASDGPCHNTSMEGLVRRSCCTDAVLMEFVDTWVPRRTGRAVR